MSLLHEAEAGLKSQSLRQALNAFISRVHDVPALLRAVGRAESRRRRDEALSPLDGRLIAIKDNICTRSFPTTCASRFLKTYNSPFDATVVDRLRNAGAVLTGKTNLDEFGMGSHSMHSFFGPVKNTLGSGDISTGGSSGGSAVAVATSQCQAALGTDTGGSIRLPAAYTGVLGFKPSYGLVSRWGVVAYANSLDTVGVFARSVTTAKDVYDVINGFDAQDPTSLPDSSRSRIVEIISKRRRGCPLCIGVPIQYNVAELNPVVKETWLRTLQRFEDDGHSVQPVSLPTTRHALSAYYVLAPAEASSNLAKYDGVRYGTRDEVDDTAGGVLYAATRGKGFGEEVKRRILLGAYSLSAEAIDNYFLQAQRVRRLVQRDFDNVFDLPNPLHARQPGNAIGGVDVLVCPTTPSLPPTLDSIKGQSPVESYTNDVLTVPASLAGLPAMSVPVSIESGQDTSTAGTAGMQLIAQYGDDDLLFDVARIMEEWKPLVSQHVDR